MWGGWEREYEFLYVVYLGMCTVCMYVRVVHECVGGWVHGCVVHECVGGWAHGCGWCMIVCECVCVCGVNECVLVVYICVWMGVINMFVHVCLV